MKPEITVLMSVHNGLPYLAAAVESILSQTFTDFEFLIIDDASTDGSATLLESYNDSRIRIIKNKECKGLGFNLRVGVEEACGTWVARMDADDIALPERLQVQRDYAHAHPDVDIIGSWATDINAAGEPLGLRRMPLNHEEIVRYIWTCPIIHPTAFFNKAAVQRAGSYGTERRRQDYALWFRCASAGLRFANIPQVLLQYRFADEYFRKNNVLALFDQATIGWKGCKMVKASPVAYVGVGVPLLRGLFPKSLQRHVSALQKRFDPRYKNKSC